MKCTYQGCDEPAHRRITLDGDINLCTEHTAEYDRRSREWLTSDGGELAQTRWLKFYIIAQGGDEPRA